MNSTWRHKALELLPSTETTTPSMADNFHSTSGPPAGPPADPTLAESAEDIIDHMNDDHVETIVLLAKAHLGAIATDARMTAVDQYGFNLMLQTVEGVRGGRNPFPAPVGSSSDCR